MENWIEIVPALPKDEARKRLDEWKAQETASGRTVRAEDVREDLVRGPQGRCLLRYCVRCRA